MTQHGATACLHGPRGPATVRVRHFDSRDQDHTRANRAVPSNSNQSRSGATATTCDTTATADGFSALGRFASRETARRYVRHRPSENHGSRAGTARTSPTRDRARSAWARRSSIQESALQRALSTVVPHQALHCCRVRGSTQRSSRRIQTRAHPSGRCAGSRTGARRTAPDTTKLADPQPIAAETPAICAASSRAGL